MRNDEAHPIHLMPSPKHPAPDVDNDNDDDDDDDDDDAAINSSPLANRDEDAAAEGSENMIPPGIPPPDVHVHHHRRHGRHGRPGDHEPAAHAAEGGRGGRERRDERAGEDTSGAKGSWNKDNPDHEGQKDQKDQKDQKRVLPIPQPTPRLKHLAPPQPAAPPRPAAGPSPGSQALLPTSSANPANNPYVNTKSSPGGPANTRGRDVQPEHSHMSGVEGQGYLSSHPNHPNRHPKRDKRGSHNLKRDHKRDTVMAMGTRAKSSGGGIIHNRDRDDFQRPRPSVGSVTSGGILARGPTERIVGERQKNDSLSRSKQVLSRSRLQTAAKLLRQHSQLHGSQAFKIPDPQTLQIEADQVSMHVHIQIYTHVYTYIYTCIHTSFQVYCSTNVLMICYGYICLYT